MKASYYNGTELAGSPVLTRLDYSPNFHFFALGPDPYRCVRACVRAGGRAGGRALPDI
eukprot:SAG22_NODE_764_length_7397_cov_6.955604_8_plen_58_part_00